MNFFHQKVDKEEIKGNMKHARYLRMLIFFETQIEIHSTSIDSKTKHSQSNITYIDIPKDTLMYWNFIPKKITQEERKIIEDPLMIETFIIERN